MGATTKPSCDIGAGTTQPRGVRLEAAQSPMESNLNQNRRRQAVGELTIYAGAGKLNSVEPNGRQT